MCASRFCATVLLFAAMTLFGFAATASADLVPLPSGVAGSYVLTGVSCPAAGECVAVGSYTDSSMNLQGLIETESGGVWSASTVDLSQLGSLAGNSNAQLTSISCTAVGDCVAVGSYYDASGAEGLIETETHGNWSGARLNLSSLPSVSSDPNVSLTSVSCPSQGYCAAVGDYNDASNGQQGLLASESNGTWTVSEADVSPIGGGTPPQTALAQVSCASAGHCAAVGIYLDNAGNTLGLIATESNGNWGLQGPDLSDLPSVAVWGTQDTLLRSVSCPSPGNCTAVGTYIDGTGSVQGMLLDERGGPWAPATEATLPGDADTTGSPAQSDLSLNSVSCPSTGNCTAVGSYDATSADDVEALVLTEAGGAWRAAVAASVPSGAAGNPEASLDSIFCRAPSTCVASGTDEASDGDNAVLIASESSGSWSTAATEQASNYSYFGVNETSVSCAANGYCANAGNLADLVADTTAFLQDAPQAPQSPQAVPSGRGAAVLSWLSPHNDPLDPGTNAYTVTVDDLADASRDRAITGTSGTKLTIGRLSPGNRYRFTVSYTSILGPGLGATSGSIALGLTRHQIARSLAALLAPKGRASRLPQLRRTHLYTFDYRPLEAGRVSVRWYQTRRYGGHRHRQLVASGSATPNGTRVVAVHVRLTAFGRQAVSSAYRLLLTATARFTSGSTTGTRTRSFTLR